jgi:hypothetical protein
VNGLGASEKRQLFCTASEQQAGVIERDSKDESQTPLHALWRFGVNLEPLLSRSAFPVPDILWNLDLCRASYFLSVTASDT